MKICYEIKPEWGNLDKNIAKCQLDNYGVIVLDQRDVPMDYFPEVEEYLHEEGIL